MLHRCLQIVIFPAQYLFSLEPINYNFINLHLFILRNFQLFFFVQELLTPNIFFIVYHHSNSLFTIQSISVIYTSNAMVQRIYLLLHSVQLSFYISFIWAFGHTDTPENNIARFSSSNSSLQCSTNNFLYQFL